MPNISFDIFFDKDFINVTASRGKVAPKAKPEWKVRTAPKLPPREIEEDRSGAPRPTPRPTINAQRNPQQSKAAPADTPKPEEKTAEKSASDTADKPKKKPPKLGPRKTSGNSTAAPAI